MTIVFVYLLILVAAFFFLVVRPQRRQMAAHRALVASLDPGDEVITTGGIVGTIRGLDEDIVELEIAPSVVVRVARGAVTRQVTPARDTPPELGDPRADGDPS
jgi:preprotein translocase subunit YajC